MQERCYKMLQHWKQRGGKAATYGILANALGDDVVQRNDLAKKYCFNVFPRAIRS